MKFSDLVQMVRFTPPEEIRLDVDNRFECVLKNEQLKTLSPKLEEFFGPPKKPAGASAKGDTVDLASDYGGILKNQTLYYVSKDGFSNIGMIWPWTDGKLTTVKIFRLSFNA